MSQATVDAGAVARAVGEVRARVEAIAGGRPVELVAVTKGFSADALRAAVAAGCTSVGENYAQELRAKVDELGWREHRPVRIHFIGQLQTNKVRTIAPFVDVWETVDRAALAAEIAKRAPGATVFVQVDLTGEPGKGGCPAADVPALVDTCRSAGLVVDGLMTVGPTSADPVATDRAFADLSALADALALPSRSMGMSGDYPAAVARGATHIRVGSALFGSRPTPARAHGIASDQEGQPDVNHEEGNGLPRSRPR